MRGFAAMLITLLAFPSTDVVAQENSLVEIGDVMRITAPGHGLDEQHARFLRLYRDTLTVQADTQLTLPLASVTRLDVSRGLSSRPTLVGIVAGAVAGVLVGIAVAPDDDTEINSGGAVETADPQIGNSGGTGGSSTLSGAAVAPIAGALIGAFVGGLVGKPFCRHNWRAIPLHELRLISSQQRGAMLAIGLSVPF